MVNGLESELAVDVVGKDSVVEDCSEAVKDATLLAVIRPVTPIVVGFTLSVASEMLLDIGNVDLNVVVSETSLIVRLFDGDVLVSSIEFVNEGCVFVAPVEDMEVKVDSLVIIELFSVSMLGLTEDDVKLTVVVLETSLIVRVVDGDVSVSLKEVVNEVCAFSAPIKDKKISTISVQICSQRKQMTYTTILSYFKIFIYLR